MGDGISLKEHIDQRFDDFKDMNELQFKVVRDENMASFSQMSESILNFTSRIQATINGLVTKEYCELQHKNEVEKQEDKGSFMNTIKGFFELASIVKGVSFASVMVVISWITSHIK
jgi:hypothetical protein